MIGSISSSGVNLLYVNQGGNNMSYINMSNPSAGMMRYNGNSQNIEVYDGNVWIQMYGRNVDIQLSPDVQMVADWAKKRMAEEAEYGRLAQSNEAVKIALDNVRKAQQQLDITAKLVKDHNETTS